MFLSGASGRSICRDEGLKRTVLDEWAARAFPMPDEDFNYRAVNAGGTLSAIHYKELDLEVPWQSFNIAHELTNTGIQRFVADYRSTLRRPA